MLSIQQVQNALIQITAIEDRLPEYISPNKICSIFQHFNMPRTIASVLSPVSFVLSKELPNREDAVRIHEQMKGILSVVTENRLIIPSQYLKAVDRFQRQMQQFDIHQAAQTASESADVQPAQHKQYPSVVDAKAKIVRPFGSFERRFGDVFYGITLFVGLVLGVSCITAIVLVSALEAMLIDFACGSILFITLHGGVFALLPFGGGIAAFIQQRATERAFAVATTLDQLVPVFSKLSTKAQARLFVELGPEFRTKLCEWNERTNKDTGLRQLADIVDVLQDENASVDDRREAFQALPLKKLKRLDIYKFQNKNLQKVLIEAKMGIVA